MQPPEQARNLIDAGNGAAGDLGELSIDLRCSGLCNLTGSLSKFPIDTEAASVDLAVEDPQCLLGRRQRRQPCVELALYIDILLAIAVEPIEALRILKPMDDGWIFVLVRTPRLRRLMHQPFASSVFAIGELQRISCGAQSAGSPVAKHIAIVQTWRSSGTIGQP